MTSFIEKLTAQFTNAKFKSLDEVLMPKLSKYIPFMSENQLNETAEYMVMKAVEDLCSGHADPFKIYACQNQAALTRKRLEKLAGAVTHLDLSEYAKQFIDKCRRHAKNNLGDSHCVQSTEKTKGVSVKAIKDSLFASQKRERSSEVFSQYHKELEQIRQAANGKVKNARDVFMRKTCAYSATQPIIHKKDASTNTSPTQWSIKNYKRLDSVFSEISDDVDFYMSSKPKDEDAKSCASSDSGIEETPRPQNKRKTTKPTFAKHRDSFMFFCNQVDQIDRRLSSDKEYLELHHEMIDKADNYLENINDALEHAEQIKGEYVHPFIKEVKNLMQWHSNDFYHIYYDEKSFLFENSFDLEASFNNMIG